MLLDLARVSNEGKISALYETELYSVWKAGYETLRHL
jgi:hypothetical protein